MALVAETVLREYLNAVGITTTTISASALSLIESQAAGQVEGYLQRNLAIGTYTQRFDIEEGTDTLFLQNFPLQNIVALTNDGLLVASGDYYSYSDEGMIKLADRLALLDRRGTLTPFFAEGKRMAVVTYSAGYTTIPPDIQNVVINLVARKLSGSGTSALTGEKIGDYSYTMNPTLAGASGGFTADELIILNRYKPQYMWWE